MEHPEPTSQPASPPLEHDPSEFGAHADPPEPSEPCPGDVIEQRYLVLASLGRGSLGVVLEAEHLHTGKRVAIKWMSAARCDSALHAGLLRFQREVRALAHICHPNLIEVLDVGEQDGTPFVVTERLHGETLRARLARGPLSWHEARQMAIGVLRGLSVAHRAGVVHRELKPENIFLSVAERDLPPTPKVLDFGVAGLRPSVSADAGVQAGPAPATAAYLALEQLTGDPVDARSDVYALGVVLYEALTQQLPLPARGAAELAVLQATSAPARPSRHRADLRGARERVLLRALAGRPPARYRDADAFAAALERRAGLSFPPLRTSSALALLVAAACAVLALREPRGVAGSPPRASASAPALGVVPRTRASVPLPGASPAVAAPAAPPRAESPQPAPFAALTPPPAQSARPQPVNRWRPPAPRRPAPRHVPTASEIATQALLQAGLPPPAQREPAADPQTPVPEQQNPYEEPTADER